MVARSFLVVTFFATMLGIGAAELVRPSLHHDLTDPRTSMVGLCLNSGIGCAMVAPVAPLRSL